MKSSSSALSSTSNEWTTLAAQQALTVWDKLIHIGDSIWLSTAYDHGEKGMIEYHIKSDRITVTPYPRHIKPATQTCCGYGTYIFIINPYQHNIIQFDTRKKTFLATAKLPNIGDYPSVCLLHDQLHIIGGTKNRKHFIYNLSTHKLMSIKNRFTADFVDSMALLAYHDRLLAFGGWNESKHALIADVMQSSAIDVADIYAAYKRLSWSPCSAHTLPQPMLNFGYVLFRDYVVLFGGTMGTQCSDDIYTLNLAAADDDASGTQGWQHKNIRCPYKSRYRAVLTDDDHVHIFSITPSDQQSKHFCISIYAILHSHPMLDDEDIDASATMDVPVDDDLKDDNSNDNNGVATAAENTPIYNVTDDVLNEDEAEEDGAKAAACVQCKDLPRTIATQSHKLDTQHAHIQQLEMDVMEYQQNALLLHQQIAELNDIIDSHKRKALTLNEQMLSSQHTLKHAESAVASMKSQHRQIAAQCEAEMSALKRSNNRHKTNEILLNHQILKLNEELKTQRMTYQTLSAEWTRMQSTHRDSQQRQTQQEMEMREVLQAQTLQNQQLSQLEITVTALKEANQIYQQQERLFNAEIIHLTQALKDSRQQLVRVQQTHVLDTHKYEAWNAEEIVQWICTLHGGSFVKYTELLRTGLTKIGVTGALLHLIDKSELKDMGVLHILDRTVIYKEIQNLIRSESVVNANANENMHMQHFASVPNSLMADNHETMTATTVVHTADTYTPSANVDSSAADANVLQVADVAVAATHDQSSTNVSRRRERTPAPEQEHMDEGKNDPFTFYMHR